MLSTWMPTSKIGCFENVKQVYYIKKNYSFHNDLYDPAVVAERSSVWQIQVVIL